MALEITRRDGGKSDGVGAVSEQRWWWNADRTALVPDGHADAAVLAYPPGSVIPAEHQGFLPKRKAPATKPAKDGETK